MSSTPMMQQFHAAKREHPDGFLFFRMGDFFELFGEDAVQASSILGLTLTSRDKGKNALPMAGVPARAADGYINRLIRQGHKVVVCDQIQDPREAKGLVERAVTRVVTPGTVLEEEGLPESSNNFLCGLHVDGQRVGIAAADLSTGTFLVEDRELPEGADALNALDAAELLLPEAALESGSAYDAITASSNAPRSSIPDWRFDRDEAERLLKDHFKVARLEGFGIGHLGPAICAAGAVLHYLKETQRGALGHMTRIRAMSRDDQLTLDRTTRTSLELVKTLKDGERKGTLLWVLDETLTPMGARQLKQWLLAPLARAGDIKVRQDGVSELLSDTEMMDDLRTQLKSVQDMDRLLSRVACGRGSARELVGLRASLNTLPGLVGLLSQAVSPILVDSGKAIPDLSKLTDLLNRALMDEVPATVKEGGMIKEGFDPQLDEVRAIGSTHRDWIARFQQTESERSGIPSLKVGFNKVFGYYIEITHAHKDRIPEDYIRKQTLKNAERYITPELKEYEEKVLGAEERIKDLEYEHYLKLRDAVVDDLANIQAASERVAVLDAIQSLAKAAEEGRYVRPEVHDGIDLEIIEGRHPVLDRLLVNEPFVPNDVQFEEGQREFILITGPNMAGKSTYIRQCALLTIMAQVGSFVPAASARIGITDRIFTRVGASDELARGNSTFMVEMIETAEILNSATNRSLVILDEVGRGTSTFDGLAIAWAITEFLAKQVHCRTLFATHYHQLLDLIDEISSARNMHVEVREWGEEIVFLHKMAEGGTDRSYGIHVARLAGLPKEVLDRAGQILKELEADPVLASSLESVADSGAPRQLLLFETPDHPALEKLRKLKPEAMTPLDAMIALSELVKSVKS